MQDTKRDSARQAEGQANAKFHVVFGSGGTKAILAGVGASLAFHVAGLSFKTIGGASGGSVPAALLANGTPMREVIRIIIDTDLNELLTARTGLLCRIWALLNKYRYEIRRPVKGIYSVRKLARFVDEKVPSWPQRFWCVAACVHGQMLFTDHGAFKYEPGNPLRKRMLSDKPHTPGAAIAASIAMPGIIDAGEYEGEHLYDGALSGDGQCPVSPAVRHFGARPEEIIAIDVGEDDAKQSAVLRFLWHLACGGDCGDIFGTHPDEAEGYIVVMPKITGFHALDFDIGANEKWRGVIGGFITTVDRLEKAGVLRQEAHDHVFALRSAFREIRQIGDKTQFVKAAEMLLSALHL